MVAVAAAVMLVVFSAVVLVTAKPDPNAQLFQSGVDLLNTLPRSEPAVGPVIVVVSCPALFGGSPAAALAPRCKVVRLQAISRECAVPGVDSVDLVVRFVGPDGRLANATQEHVPCHPPPAAMYVHA